MARKKSKKTAANRYEHLACAQAELDFHGSASITSQEVKHRTQRFIAQARKDGHQKVRIITGKGIHSKSTPLVKPQVRRTLTQLMENGEIHNFYAEKPRLGGEGAFAIEL